MAMLRSETAPSWGAFATWAMAGILWTISVVSFGAGLFILPLAILVTAFLIRDAPNKRDSLGLAAGIGALLLIIGFMNLGYQTCPDGPRTISPPLGEDYSFSCGGFDPRPWLAVGFVVLVGSVAWYNILRRKPLA